jgi:hypothetical protein
VSLTDHQRAQVVSHWEFLIASGEKHVGYEFGGGRTSEWMDSSQTGMAAKFAAGETWYPDCSATVQWVCKWAGWKSPTGLGWTGSSGEMFAHLPHFTNVRACKLGTIVVYGVDGADHVAQVIGGAGSSDPMLGSHGSAFSSNTISYSNLTAYFAGLGKPVALLAVGDL